jgi:hypothetical protein
MVPGPALTSLDMIEMQLIPRPGSTVVPMSTPHPHSAADLALAPVLISIERNLAALRTCADLEFALALDQNDDARWYHTPAERAQRLRQSAIRNVDLHGWTVTPTEDGYGLAVTHGEYSVPVMLGKRLTDYVEDGLIAAQPGGTPSR